MSIGSITSLEMDNAYRNVCTNIVKRVSIQYENNEIIVRKKQIRSDGCRISWLISYKERHQM